MKRPAFQFYPADWRKDAALQSCSVAAQGLWINILCIAHECEPYGHLTINGRPMTSAQIGRLVGLSSKECGSLLDELQSAGVLDRTSEGAIFSRRMVRDEDLRNRRASGGIEGAEHGKKGAEHGVKGGRPTKGRGVIEPPLEPPPSSSPSTSTSVLKPIADAIVKKKRSSVLPDGFEPNEAGIAASDGIDVPAELDAFRNYHTGKGSVMADWQAAWRTWCGNARKFGKLNAPSKPAEPAWRTDARNRMQQAVPSIAERSPNSIPVHKFFEIEAKNVAAIAVG